MLFSVGINVKFLKIHKPFFWNIRGYSDLKLNLKLGFIGVGKIAQAMMVGMIDRKIIKDCQIYASDKNLETNKQLQLSKKFQNLKINFCETNQEVIRNANTIILSVKPNDMESVLNDISQNLTENHLLLSIAAGIRLKQIRSKIPHETRIIRIMTNLAVLIQEGTSVFVKSANCTIDDVKLVKSLLESIGTCEGEIDEELIDIITALSGSGPAYMCLVIESLADGAVKMGLNKNLALRLAVRTMLGTAIMLLRNDSTNLNQIMEDVSSPGGTTIHGISQLEKYSVRYALISCIEQATKRSKELSNLSKS